MFLVNGDTTSAMGNRARAFAERLSTKIDSEITYRSGRRLRAIGLMLRVATRFRPNVVYIVDLAVAPVMTALVYRVFRRCRVVIDTGDAIVELARITGRGRVNVGLTRLLEWLGYRIASHVVVRGTLHKELLSARRFAVTVIPDGVDTSEFTPQSGEEFRRRHGIKTRFVVGLVGSSVLNPLNGTAYGWELVEALNLLRDVDVTGVLIGDGSGIESLKKRCRELDLQDKMLFVGRIEPEDLPKALAALDIGLSTQTNDVCGNVRTTGKLPLYLSMDIFVLATRVGEASLVLPDTMLLDFEGSQDPTYPIRLAARIRQLVDQPSAMALHGANRQLGLMHFEYDTLADLVYEVVNQDVTT